MTARRQPWTNEERWFYTEVGLRVALIRSVKRLTQVELARRSGVSRTTIANIETGRQGLPLLTFKRLADGLGVRLTQLLPTRPKESR